MRRLYSILGSIPNGAGTMVLLLLVFSYAIKGHQHIFNKKNKEEEKKVIVALLTGETGLVAYSINFPKIARMVFAHGTDALKYHCLIIKKCS